MKRLIPVFVVLIVTLGAMPALAGNKQTYFSFSISGWDGGGPYSVARVEHRYRGDYTRHDRNRYWRHEEREHRFKNHNRKHHRKHFRRPVIYERVVWTPPPRFIYRNWRYMNHQSCQNVKRPPRPYWW